MVDTADIIRMVGQSAFTRGQQYARDGAVAAVEWDAPTDRLRGVVYGTRAEPYHCLAELAPSVDARRRPVRSACTCPMSTGCKHVAAMLLRSNALHVREATSGGAGTPPVRTWKSVLTGLTAPGASAGIGHTPSTTRTPLGLQFAVRDEALRPAPRWLRQQTSGDGRRPGPGTGSSGNPAVRVRLGVRPVVFSAAGNWTASIVTWRNIPYQLSRLNFDPEQHRWFCQFPALHSTGPHVYLGDTSAWVDLDDFASPLLWHLLDEAVRIGIPLVAKAKHGTVEVGGAAEVLLDATRTATGVQLAPTVRIDGERVALESVRLIGNHGVYRTDHGGARGERNAAAPSVLRLSPTVAPITAEQRRLLEDGDPALVPAEEVAEFLAEFYPTLRQAVPVTSSDASVDLPELAPPVLVLTAAFRPHHALRLEWHWEYRLGERLTRTPLTPEPDTGGYRDAGAEREILDRATRLLRSAGTTDAAGSLQGGIDLAGMAAAEFTEKVLPALGELDGIRVDVVGEKPDYRELTAAPTLTVRTVETDERDWFDLGVLVTVDGREVPFGPLFTALAQGSDTLLLADGSYLSLNQPVFGQLRELIAEARALDEWKTGLRISRYQASLWADLEELADETEQAEAWRATARGLLGTDGVDATPLPSGLAATLRPYQADGFQWLAFLHRHRLGGILADDMGLGKTLQTLALLAHATEQRAARVEGSGPEAPFLVVAPASVVSNWLSESGRFAPGLRVVGITSTQAKSGVQLAESIAGADLVVTSYTLFRLDFDAYRSAEWAGLILDEAQFVKNPASVAHQCARDLSAPFKLAITGTPMENNLMELWALFAIVAPGLLPPARRFVDEYQRPIERGAGASAGAGIGGDPDAASQLLARLRRRIRPLMLRRTKELVAKDLPAKQEQLLQVDLAPKHRKLYDMFLQRERQKLLGLIDDLDKNRFLVFRSLTLLRMLSLDASLVDEKYGSVPSSKLDALFEQLEDVVAEGHRALVFSQFTSFLGKAAARLNQLGVDYCYLDGSTRRRADVIRRFKTGTAPVFLISLKAGGFGLNLTEADYVFLLDPWWNPATEEQAVDRTHRIGQTRNVMVYRMVAEGTIEEKVMALKERKAKLFSSVMDDDAAFSSALTADDIRALLNS